MWNLAAAVILLKHKKSGDDITIMVYRFRIRKPDKEMLQGRFSARKRGKEAQNISNAKLCCDKEPIILVPTEKPCLELEEIVIW